MWRRWVCLARYEANGNVAAIEDANNVVTKASYNAIGQRMSVNDPSQGMPEHELGHDFGLKHRGNGVMSYTGKSLQVRKEELGAIDKLY